MVSRAGNGSIWATARYLLEMDYAYIDFVTTNVGGIVLGEVTLRLRTLG